jgi:hypothetical protein
METRNASNRIEELCQRLGKIESLLEALQAPKSEKHFYTTKEAAERLDLSNWYVRKHCADGVILAEKYQDCEPQKLSAS